MKHALTTLLALTVLLLCGCGSSKGSSQPKSPYDFAPIEGSWSATCTESWGSYAYIPVGTTASFEVSASGFFDGLDDSGHAITTQLEGNGPFVGFFIRTSDGSRHRVFLNVVALEATVGSVSGGPVGLSNWTIARIVGGG